MINTIRANWRAAFRPQIDSHNELLAQLKRLSKGGY